MDEKPTIYSMLSQKYTRLQRNRQSSLCLKGCQIVETHQCCMVSYRGREHPGIPLLIIILEIPAKGVKWKLAESDDSYRAVSRKALILT